MVSAVGLEAAVLWSTEQQMGDVWCGEVSKTQPPWQVYTKHPLGRDAAHHVWITIQFLCT